MFFGTEKKKNPRPVQSEIVAEGTSHEQHKSRYRNRYIMMSHGTSLKRYVIICHTTKLSFAAWSPQIWAATAKHGGAMGKQQVRKATEIYRGFISSKWPGLKSWEKIVSIVCRCCANNFRFGCAPCAFHWDVCRMTIRRVHTRVTWCSSCFSCPQVWTKRRDSGNVKT